MSNMRLFKLNVNCQRSPSWIDFKVAQDIKTRRRGKKRKKGAREDWVI